MDLDEALRTTGAVRSFTDEPVDDSTVAAILDAARFAPSGGNRQPWRIAVVRDPDVRRRLAELQQAPWNEYVAARTAGQNPFDPVGDVPVTDPPHARNPLLEHYADPGPVVLVVAVDLRLLAVMDAALDRPSVVGGASIYPFCWSILLAARDHDVAGVLTTFLARAEPDAGPLLGLPEHHAIAAAIVLGHPDPPRPTRLTRHPVDAFATAERFDGPSFPSA